NRAELEQEIVRTSLRFGVLSRFTAFVAVDRSEVVNEGGEQKTITQPVEAPSGWEQSYPMHAMGGTLASAGQARLRAAAPQPLAKGGFIGGGGGGAGGGAPADPPPPARGKVQSRGGRP